jgi:hypothetical protein
MKNWYRVKTNGHVERFDVNRTDEGYMQSACAWTQDKLLAALVTLAEKDGVTNLRIVEFQPTSAPHPSWNVKVVDLDKLLGI